MFYSENLLAKEGPLAQVWLAANLERKLSKQQFLQSNISQSTEAIVKAASNNDDSEALALRLSGQLLYGVVRIYSRKAKYLLDDVSEALLKLKSSFKSNSNTVTLPVSATIVPSVNQLILQDTITQSDLLYQAPLVFDDEDTPGKSYASIFGASHAATNQDFDESIEIPRNKFDDLDELQNAEDDLDIDLNFEIEDDENKGEEDAHLSFDQSIEIGRAGDEANLSTQPQVDDGFDYDFGDDGNFDIDLGIDEVVAPLTPPAEEPTKEAQSVKKPRKQRTSTAGQRKIVNDREIEIPVKSFSNTADIVDNDEEEHELDLNAKRSHINEILNDNFIYSEMSRQLLDIRSNKRQKTMPSPPADDLRLPELEHPQDQGNDRNSQGDGFGIDDGFDYDFGGWDDISNNNAEQQEQLLENEIEHNIPEERFVDSFSSSGSKDGISESTIKISSRLIDIFETEEETTFTGVIEKDSLSEKPLSSLPKSEATRVFFEMLVLGTNDAVDLKQQQLFGEIQVKPRKTLFQKFL